VGTIAYTFGTGMAAAAVVLWIFVWALVAVRIVRRRDLGLGGKVLWLAVILLVPLVGLFVYFLWDAARPRPA
jgi:Phospholipase_D-nuclease N-terminal